MILETKGFMSDHDNFGTVLLNLDSILQEEKNKHILDLFDDEGKQMARRIFGEGITPYANDPDKFKKAEKINVVIRLLSSNVDWRL